MPADFVTHPCGLACSRIPGYHVCRAACGCAALEARDGMGDAQFPKTTTIPTVSDMAHRCVDAGRSVAIVIQMRHVTWRRCLERLPCWVVAPIG
jgi:hypothetical protein